jgi:hypothetical protein
MPAVLKTCYAGYVWASSRVVQDSSESLLWRFPVSSKAIVPSTVFQDAWNLRWPIITATPQ